MSALPSAIDNWIFNLKYIISNGKTAPVNSKPIPYLDGTYEGELNESNQPHGRGTLTHRDGSVYFGEFENGMKQKGEQLHPGGSRYEGSFVNNERSGQGSFFCHKSRCTYRGKWLNNKRHGEGDEYNEAEQVVAGPNWVNDRLEGAGREQYDNGDVYQGEFINGKREGHGCLLMKDDSKYEGFWQDHKCHGQGKLWDQKGVLIEEGEWQNGQLHGEGTKVLITTKDSQERFTGTFVNGKANGQGTMVYSKGGIEQLRITGNFKDGLPNGDECKMTGIEGEIYEGALVNGKRTNGLGQVKYPDGRCYSGEWQNGQMHGNGTMVNADKSVQGGEWKFNKLDGEAFEFNSHGRYIGSFVAGKRHGQGVLVDFNGEIFTQRPKDGKVLQFSGSFVDGKPSYSGQGEIKFEDGRIYTGDLHGLGLNGGKGFMKFPDDSIFDGTFRSGFLEGIGMEIDVPSAGGVRTIGLWNNGKLVRKCTIHPSSLFGGGPHLTEEDFKATLLFENGDRYVGELDSTGNPHTVSNVGQRLNRANQVLNRGKWVHGEFQQRRLALVVGIAEYEHIPKLAAPKNDASDVQQALSALGFEVTMLLEPMEVTLKGLLDGFFKFVKKLQEGDFSFVYVSSHGMSHNGKEYILPTDFRTGSNVAVGAGFPLSDITRELSRIQQHPAVVVFDICRDEKLHVDNSTSSIASSNIDLDQNLALDGYSSHAGAATDLSERKEDSSEFKDASAQILPSTSDLEHTLAEPDIPLAQPNFQPESNSISPKGNSTTPQVPINQSQMFVAYASDLRGRAFETSLQSRSRSCFTQALLQHIHAEDVPIEQVFTRANSDLHRRWGGHQRAGFRSTLIDDQLYLNPKKAKMGWMEWGLSFFIRTK